MWGRHLPRRGIAQLPTARGDRFLPTSRSWRLEQERKQAGKGYWSDCPEGLWGCRGNELVASGQCAAAGRATALFVPVGTFGLPPGSLLGWWWGAAPLGCSLSQGGNLSDSKDPWTRYVPAFGIQLVLSLPDPLLLCLKMVVLAEILNMWIFYF